MTDMQVKQSAPIVLTDKHYRVLLLYALKQTDLTMFELLSWVKGDATLDQFLHMIKAGRQEAQTGNQRKIKRYLQADKELHQTTVAILKGKRNFSRDNFTRDAFIEFLDSIDFDYMRETGRHRSLYPLDLQLRRIPDKQSDKSVPPKPDPRER